MNISILAAFGLYFTALACISFHFYRRTTTAGQFLVGGRALNYWVTAISAQASDMGPWLFMGFPGLIYQQGLFEAWSAIGLALFMWLNWQYVAPRLRVATEHYNSITIISFFSQKLQDDKGTLRITCALAALTFFTFYIAAGLVGLGQLFESSFGINYHIGILLGVITVVTCTLFGGLTSIAWTDFFQGIFLLGVIIFVPAYALYALDNTDLIRQVALLKHIPLSLFPADRSLIAALIATASWGLGYFGQLHVLINFMGINDVKKMRNAQYVGMTWQILCLAAAVGIGIIGIAYFPQELPNRELVFILMAQRLLPGFVIGLALCAIVAAAVSSIDSQILVATSVIAEDIYKKLLHPEATSQHVMWLSRIGTIIIPLVGAAIAYHNSKTIYDLVHDAWNGLGSSFGPLVLLSLYSNRITKEGATCGVAVGALIALFWQYAGTTIPALLPGFGMSLACIWIVSLLTYKPQSHNLTT